MPELAAAIGWKYQDGWLRERRGTKWEKRVPYGVEVGRVMTESGVVRGFAVRFVRQDGTGQDVSLPSRVLSATRPSDAIRDAGGPDLTSRQAGYVVEMLSAVAALGEFPGVGRAEVITETRWDGDDLAVPTSARRPAPEARALARYGGLGDVSEGRARECWREVHRIASLEGNERLALVLGMPLGSLFVERLRLDIFALHVKGDTTQGKTDGATSAMNEVGHAVRPDGPLYETWNASARAYGNDLKERGVLPFFLDEAGASSMTDEQWTTTIFEMASGRERRVAGTDGRNVSEGRSWHACTLSTGEVGLAAKSNLGGVRRRVLEVRAPLATSDEEGSGYPGNDSDRVLALATEAHGWPLEWLAESPDPAGFDEARARIERAVLSDLSRAERLTFVEAGNVATCMAGFGRLGELAGAPRGEALAAAVGQARALYTDLRDAHYGEGAGLADRAMAALRAHRLTHVDEWLAADEEFARRRVAVLFGDSTFGILDKAFLGELLPGHDPDTVLEALREAGDLVVPRSRRGLKSERVVFVPGRGRASTMVWVVRERLTDTTDTPTDA